jgi:hypothetical protein
MKKSTKKTRRTSAKNEPICEGVDGNHLLVANIGVATKIAHTDVLIQFSVTNIGNAPILFHFGSEFADVNQLPLLPHQSLFISVSQPVWVMNKFGGYGALLMTRPKRF